MLHSHACAAMTFVRFCSVMIFFSEPKKVRMTHCLSFVWEMRYSALLLSWVPGHLSHINFLETCNLHMLKYIRFIHPCSHTKRSYKTFPVPPKFPSSPLSFPPRYLRSCQFWLSSPLTHLEFLFGDWFGFASFFCFVYCLFWSFLCVILFNTHSFAFDAFCSV